MADLSAVVRELDRHAAAAGWDRRAQVFALVSTRDLVEREPGLAGGLADAGELTPVQQDELPGEELEPLLQRIVWPDSVAGCAAVVERLVLPPEADAEIPADREEAAAFASSHPGRQEVRITAAATRAGETGCALRLREHDDDALVLVGPDLVPGLVEMLRATLEDEPHRDPGDGSAQ
ncbi:MAG: PPA1309 family protein [Marmoricola sp.]